MSRFARAVTALGAASPVLLGVLIVVMAYGMYAFPAAPFHHVGGSLYADKRGRVHTRDEFDQLQAWERILIASWLASAVSGASYQYSRRHTKRK
jgi:hypothetical protein